MIPACPSLLLIEDDPISGLTLQRYLHQHFTCTLATTSGQALAQLEYTNFDALLIDIGLDEERDGLQLLEVIRAMPAYAAIPAVAVTGTQLFTAEQLVARGFTRAFFKPTNMAGITSYLQELLPNGKAYRPYQTQQPNKFNSSHAKGLSG